MSLIAVDIDSTLHDFERPLRDAFLKLAEEVTDSTHKEEYIKGAYHVWDEWRSPADICGLTEFCKALDIVHSDKEILSRRPYEGAAETIQALVESGHNIRYVSNRKTDAQDATAKWLWNWGFPLDGPNELICTQGSKLGFLAGCQHLIDDRPRTLVDFVYSGKNKKGFALLFAYNRNLTDIPNIFLAPTWSGLRSYLLREGVLDTSVMELETA